MNSSSVLLQLERRRTSSSSREITLRLARWESTPAIPFRCWPPVVPYRGMPRTAIVRRKHGLAGCRYAGRPSCSITWIRFGGALMELRVNRVVLRGILESRGERTVEAELELAGGGLGLASAPIAIKPGRLEKSRSRIRELGRLDAIAEFAELRQQIEGKLFPGQQEFDACLESMTVAMTLGADVSMALSIAFCRACAQRERSRWQRISGRWPVPGPPSRGSSRTSTAGASTSSPAECGFSRSCTCPMRTA